MLNITDADIQGFLATRLIGLMVYRSRLALEAPDPAVREGASEWLASSDEGLGSLVTASKHLAFCCQRLAPGDLDGITRQLSSGTRQPELRDPAEWQDICRDPQTDSLQLLETIENTAEKTYPEAAPAREDFSFTPSPMDGPGPGR